jgi:hypothetical protein
MRDQCLGIGFLGVAFAAITLSVASIACFVRVYSPSTNQEFISWDDPQNYGPGNRFLAELSWARINDILSDGVVLAVYEPVALIFKLLAKELIGLSAKKVVITSSVLHALNTVAVWWVASTLVIAASGPGLLARKVAQVWGCWYAALLFAVHPLRVEVVVWASCQPYLLSSLFALLSIYCYTRYRVATPIPLAEGSWASWFRLSLPPSPWKVAGLTFYVLACFSKAVAVPIATVLVVLDMCVLVRHSPSRGEEGRYHSRASGQSINSASGFFLPFRLLLCSLFDHGSALLITVLLISKTLRANTVDGINFWVHEPTLTPLQRLYRACRNLQHLWLPFAFSSPAGTQPATDSATDSAIDSPSAFDSATDSSTDSSTDSATDSPSAFGSLPAVPRLLWAHAESVNVRYKVDANRLSLGPNRLSLGPNIDAASVPSTIDLASVPLGGGGLDMEYACALSVWSCAVMSLLLGGAVLLLPWLERRAREHAISSTQVHAISSTQGQQSEGKGRHQQGGGGDEGGDGDGGGDDDEGGDGDEAWHINRAQLREEVKRLERQLASTLRNLSFARAALVAFEERKVPKQKRCEEERCAEERCEEERCEEEHSSRTGADTDVQVGLSTGMGMQSTCMGMQTVWLVRVLCAWWWSYVALSLPTAGLVQHGYLTLTSDRYSYMPSLCFVPLAGSFCGALAVYALGLDTSDTPNTTATASDERTTTTASDDEGATTATESTGPVGSGKQLATGNTTQDAVGVAFSPRLMSVMCLVTALGGLHAYLLGWESAKVVPTCTVLTCTVPTCTVPTMHCTHMHRTHMHRWCLGGKIARLFGRVLLASTRPMDLRTLHPIHFLCTSSYPTPNTINGSAYVAPDTTNRSAYVAPNTINTSANDTPETINRSAYVAPDTINRSAYVAPNTINRSAYTLHSAHCTPSYI